MCIKLSRDAFVQFRIESRSVIPCGIGFLEIISVLELAITDIFLLESGHVERLEMNNL